LNFPKTDPHGSPIPDKLGNISALKTQKLSECKVKDLLRFTGVLQSSQAFLIYLNERNFALGMEFEIVKKEDFDQSITIQINEHSTFVLSDIVCQRILVERIKN
jgi:DtxR family Mn-dependent transcriptional regulator